MRFKLTLKPRANNPWLMWNYHYPLASWLYGILAKADKPYATFLHQKGYASQNTKTFKHFNFSDLVLKIGKQNENGFEVTSPSISWTVSFVIDRAAENFIVGLFQSQEIRLFNRDFDTTFLVERIETLGPIEITETVCLRASSAMVIAEKVQGIDKYLEPSNPKFAHYLCQGLVDKYMSILLENGQETAIKPNIDFKLIDDSKMKSRKITIKEGKDAATQIRGFRNFVFELTAPIEVLNVAIYGGLGKHCAEGFGFCEVV